MDTNRTTPQTPGQPLWNEKARKTPRPRRRTRNDRAKDIGASTTPVSTHSAQEDQDNLIYVGGNYMGSPDYQESYQDTFHNQLVERWLRCLNGL
jgi:hypothetical protein